MKNLIHKHIMVRSMFVFLFLLPSLTFSQDNPYRRVDVDAAISADLVPIAFDSPYKKSASSAVREQLWNLEETYMQNYKDKNIEVLTEFWDEKFIGWPEWAEEPVDVNKAKHELSKPSENIITSFKIRPQNMALKGNIAVVYYFIDLNLENRAQEKSTATFRIIHTWLNKDGKWQILGGMSAK